MPAASHPPRRQHFVKALMPLHWIQVMLWPQAACATTPTPPFITTTAMRLPPAASIRSRSSSSSCPLGTQLWRQQQLSRNRGDPPPLLLP